MPLPYTALLPRCRPPYALTSVMLRLEIRLVVFLAALALLFLLAVEWSVDGRRYGPALSDGDSPRRRSAAYGSAGIISTKTPIKKRQKSYSFDPLPSNIVGSVDSFLFFVGYARSGHSIVASFLDAHPNVVIAHEYTLFSRWAETPDLFNNRREFLFNTLFNSSHFSAQAGLRQGKGGIKKKGYSLEVPGWYQGTYEGGITVIGDKAGGMTAQVYRRNKDKFVSVYQQLCSTAGVPVYVIHVVRNPYDNIATMLLYNDHVKQTANVTHKYRNIDALRKQTKAYFVQVESVLGMIKQAGLNDITIHHSSFVNNPKGTMRRICNSLSVTCSESYLQMVADHTFSTESQSRHMVEWTPELVKTVEANIAKHPILRGYTFE